ncbi:ATP-dependent zinc protease [Arthrobacter sp. NEB 688]|uniref:ATP-dependent zinc protease family protein n=1 Tax=Arthrobacter sp. NEB 688 TaxID=904039 RepID=UPI001567A2A8|nr:ATP-dependent zinc protease [Arthrobacter sp. NEB 688]QKE84366.1 ATP-dependent zinc protease [Arthrobacter sp. NEB 688]
MTDSHSYTLAGWREWVSLPTIGVPWVKAKLDTGARSSSIHAFDLEDLERDGERWARFRLQPWQRSDADAVRCECPVLDVREVRSSSGHSEERLVVAMDLVLMGRTVAAEMTLANRDEMGFRMLVGREALRQGFAVDPGRSYLGGRPPLAMRRRNRGRA